ncbi:MAG: hypothetical protein M3Q74_13170 [Pseudomonadota bacterium]|nr:hypothetical protein [Pseudomonadota bacterium]
MLYALIAAALLASPQSVPAPQTPPASQDPVRLEDLVVDSRRLEDTTEDYVDEVAAPARRRGLARWKDGMCVGVVNLEGETAQYLADRVSDVARGLGLRAHEPECHPSVLIVATSDGPGFTQAFVDMRPRLFRVGGAGMDRGSAELRDFINEERPVRWWHVSLPVDSETGDAVVRFPGQVSGSGANTGGSSAQDYAPQTAINAPSRLNDQTEDILKRVFIIVDVDQLNGASLQQLGDYVAMVAMAQVDPDADTGRFDTILNLFDDPATAPTGLTGWDRAYLEGLYDPNSETHRINQRAQVQAVASAIASAYRGSAAEPGDLEQP